MPSNHHRPHQTTSTSRSSSSTTSRPLRRNLFNSAVNPTLSQSRQQRPTTGSSTSTSAETLRLDMSAATTQGSQSHALASPTEASTAGIVTASVGDIVIRDRNGEFDIGGVPLGLDRMMGGFGDGEEGDGEIVGCSAEDFEEKERQRLAEAVKHHCRDRNRAPSEPVELLEAVRASLRAKMVALGEDSWMYESGI